MEYLYSTVTTPWLNTTGLDDDDVFIKAGNGIGDSQPEELFKGYPGPLLDFAAACCILFMIIGVPGNLITVIALFRYKKVRNATAVFIMNLSVSDLAFCCFNLPLAARLFWERAWTHGELLCHLSPLLRYGLLAVSLFTVLAITINRYVMIGHPRLYPKMYRDGYLACMVAATWLGGFGALVATWFGRWGRFGLDVEVGSCSILPDKDGHTPKAFLFIVAFIIPCLCILICYARIFYIVRKTALKSRSAPRSNVVATKNHSSSTQKETSQEKPDEIPDDSAFGTLSTAATLGYPNEGTSYLQDESSFNVSNSDKKLPKLDNFKNSKTSINSSNSENVQMNDFPKKSPAKLNNATSTFQASQNSLSQNENNEKYTLLSENDNSFYVNNNGEEVKINLNNQEPERNPGILVVPNQKYNSSRQINIDDSQKNEIASLENGSKTDPSKKRSASVVLSNIANNLFRRQSNFKCGGKNEENGRTGWIHHHASVSQSSIPGKMTAKDKKILKMILVIFLSFVACYLPITLSKTFTFIDSAYFNIMGYILIYMTPCINPLIYVVMSSEYRQAYKNLLMCKNYGSEGSGRST